MPTIPLIVTEFINLLAQLLRLVGMLALGFGTARLALEFFRKGPQTWQVPALVFFSFSLLIVGLAEFGSPATLAGFALGAGGGLLASLAGEKKKEETKEG